MNLSESFVSQLDAETPRTRRALEQVPEGRDDWKPHEKSMPLGRLVVLVAGMPLWFVRMLEHDDLDLNPPGGPQFRPPAMATRAERLQAFDDGIAAARAAFGRASEAHLLAPWRLKLAGRVVSEQPRHVVIRDTFMHLAHHRGQLSVYLRLVGATVPAIYGPSADDARFA